MKAEEVWLELGDDYPYDDGRPCVDAAHRAARGIMANLQDRRGVKHGFAGIDKDVREEIVDTMAAIIRLARKGR